MSNAPIYLPDWMTVVRKGHTQKLKKEFHPQSGELDDHAWMCLFSRVYQAPLSKVDTLLKILIERGGNINASNAFGVTALEDMMHVCVEETWPYLDLFVKHGTDIKSLQDKLIGLLASHGNADGILWLDKQGVDVTLCYGKSTYEIFKQWAHDLDCIIPDEIEYLLHIKPLKEHLEKTLPTSPPKPVKRV